MNGENERYEVRFLGWEWSSLNQYSYFAYCMASVVDTQDGRKVEIVRAYDQITAIREADRLAKRLNNQATGPAFQVVA